MILAGERESVLNSERLELVCPECDQKGLIGTINQRYVHVYYLSFFPSSKIAQVSCPDCNSVWRANQLNQVMENAVADLKAEARTPLWTFSGIGISILFLALFIPYMIITNNKINNLLQHPKLGDIYVIETEENTGRNLKIIQLEKDTMVFLLSKPYWTLFIKPDADTSVIKYTDSVLVLSRMEIIQAYSNQEFVEIIRK